LLREAAVATVMVTHDPAEAEAVGDQVSWLDACCRGGDSDSDACARC
jgi:ABC-type nitrate/sulfonate/bicarbonate transport system ATPase subunit